MGMFIADDVPRWSVQRCKSCNLDNAVCNPIPMKKQLLRDDGADKIQASNPPHSTPGTFGADIDSDPDIEVTPASIDQIVSYLQTVLSKCCCELHSIVSEDPNV